MDILLLADPEEEQIAKYLSDSSIFLAKNSDQIIGVIVVKVSAVDSEIMNVAVKEEYQRKGIGKMLIHQAIQLLKQSGIKTLSIGTADTSVHQLSLYKKLGFSEVERLEDFFTKNYKEAIYENGIRAKDMIRLEMSLT